MKIKRKTLQDLKKWFLRIIIISMAVGVWYIYSWTSLFTVTSYALVGVDPDKVQVLTDVVSRSSHTYTFGIIPNDKVLSYKKASITTAVISLIPELRSIEIKPVGFHTVRITITKWKPLFRTDDTTGVTDSGILFNTKEDLSSYPLLQIASSTKKVIKNGTLSFFQIDGLDSSFLRNLSEFEKKVTAVIFPVSTIVIDGNGDISLTDELGLSKVFVNKDADLKKAWSTLLSAIDTDPLKTKLLNNKDKLSYLDVRFGNKIFYKFSTTTPFQNSSVNAILVSHASTTPTFGATTSVSH